MNTELKFSVLMPVYAKEKPEYFSLALESIFNQSLVPNEVVVVQDGPLTLDLYTVISQFMDKFPSIMKIVNLEKNSGLGIALNHGIEACSYDWIARMDSDDFSVYDRFKKQVNYLAEHPEVDLLGSNIQEYDEDMTKVISVRKVPESHDEIIASIKKRSPFNHMTVFYRKTKVIERGSYEDCISFEDYYLWCKLAIGGLKFHNLQENLVNMRTGNAIAKRRGGKKYLLNMLGFQKRIYKLGMLSFLELTGNILIRGTVAVLPASLRVFLYRKSLRSTS